jgi:hypothetical protein
MAALVKNRVPKQLSWPTEEDGTRGERRAALCELDGMLTQLEEINLHSRIVPGWVRAALQRHGVDVKTHHTAAEMIEAIFLIQERYMLRPEVAGPVTSSAGCARELDELRRRMAS